MKAVLQKSHLNHRKTVYKGNWTVKFCVMCHCLQHSYDNYVINIMLFTFSTDLHCYHYTSCDYWNITEIVLKNLSKLHLVLHVISIWSIFIFHLNGYDWSTGRILKWQTISTACNQHNLLLLDVTMLPTAIGVESCPTQHKLSLWRRSSQLDRHWQTIHKLYTTRKKANNYKDSKTKLPWFSCLLWHSASKRDGLILQW